MGMQKCYLVPLRDVIKAVHLPCNFSFLVSKTFLKPNALFVLPLEKSKHTETELTSQKEYQSLSAVFLPKWILWVKMMLVFAWMVSQRGKECCRCCAQHVWCGSHLLSIRKDLRQGWLCVLLPQLTWGMEPLRVKPGYWRAKQCTALRCSGNPWAKDEFYLPLFVQILISFSFFLWRTFILRVSAPGWIPMWCKLL